MDAKYWTPISPPAARLMARLDAFAAFSDEPGRLTRLFLSEAPSTRRARFRPLVRRGRARGADRRRRQCRRPLRGQARGRAGADAGLAYRHRARRRALRRKLWRIGCARPWSRPWPRRGERLDHAIEIVAFGDEEGVRFRTTLTGSRALAGTYPEDALDQRDSAGVSMREALKAFGGDPEQAASIRRSGVAAFVEAHIEQGPILEAEGLPLGIVTAINGASRLEVGVDGVAGHAGATPMALRRDALTAAAEMALAIEARARERGRSCRDRRPLRRLARRDQRHSRPCPVFDRHSRASRRAPGRGRRRPRGAHRRDRGSARRQRNLRQAARRQRLRLRPRIIAGLTKAVEAVGARPRLLPSGAGHDAMAIGKLCPAGHAVRALQGRDQPQSARIDHARGLRARPRGADAVRAGLSRRLKFRRTATIPVPCAANRASASPE